MNNEETTDGVTLENTSSKKEIQKAIAKQIFRLEHTNYVQKTLKSEEIISKIRKIVEDEIK